MKPIRLIELFGGYGSQHFAFKRLGVEFEQWKLCEWAVPSIIAYKDAHFKEDNTDYSVDLTREEVVDFLFEKHISMNYKEPMTRKQIVRLGEKKERIIYNDIIATENYVDVQQVKGSDLEIVDTDKFDYLMTYSFPCQDLSLAGLQKGMEKGSNTSSSMLWEVERILNECEELPKYLVMENVPQVHGKKNLTNFNKWINFLREKGYANFWQDMNAREYGVPQNRNRTFMVSILGGGYFEFPEGFDSGIRLKDILETEVDEKYYISEKMLKGLIKHNENHEGRTGFVWKPTDVQGNAKCIRANGAFCPTDNSVVVREATKKGYAIAQEGDSINISQPNSNTRRGRVGKGIANTLLTSSEQCVIEPQACAIRGRNPNNPKSRVSGLPTKQMLEINKNPNISNCLTTVQKDSMIIEYLLRIRKLIPLECGRLMGLRDNEYYDIAENQSDSSLYHLFGDSIVIDVLVAILDRLLLHPIEPKFIQGELF